MSIFGDNSANAHMTITAPTAGAAGSGAFTLAALNRYNFFGGGFAFLLYQSNDLSFYDIYVDGDIWCEFQRADTNIPNWSNPPLWFWFVVTKSAGAALFRAHYAVYSATGTLTWVHIDSVAPVNAHGAINRVSIGDEFGTPYRGSLTCATIFTSEMTDAQVEATFLRSSAAVMAASPQFFVHFPEAAGLGSPFSDLAGGGIETIRTGTWDIADDPPSFDFTLASRSGKPKVWDGTTWVQHQAKVWNGTSWVNHAIKGHNGSSFVTAK